ncbi:hypothetical protein [Bacillus cereus group sp. BfR-BA-01310]|uniref:hypothetical protein n=1 Tax=Bacillus cereus group sp. BfR-BA-01310 TaxID=2920287 RepID=UPI001F55E4BC|nr:hypothetical protein [Bacillus cereus group sp. BfR-BA-01310]
MRSKKYTVIFIFLAIASNFVLSMWLKQGLFGVVIAIILLLIAAWTTKQPTDDQHK